ncbi:MAG TPA: thermonuclease family protein [Gammaproteobacteria bacterium]|nr:thermonuclease family protein [Gammaproteobacteria bacterium]
MRSAFLLLALFVAPLAACDPPPSTLSGVPKLIDGDSFEIAGTGVRLFGIDAPEGRQTCRRNGADWPCGSAAAQKLAQLVGADRLVCTRKDTDNYGRVVAVCRAGGVDVAREMVTAGLALAYRRYSNDYVGAEAEARAAKRGLWAGDFTPPWDWRQTGDRRSAGEPSAPSSWADCRGKIKGNISLDSGRRIYHVPGSRDYESTKIDENKGERWFCTEQEAIRAGWRAPRG